MWRSGFPTFISTSSLLLSSNINFRTHLISPPILCSRIRLGLCRIFSHADFTDDADFFSKPPRKRKEFCKLSAKSAEICEIPDRAGQNLRHLRHLRALYLKAESPAGRGRSWNLHVRLIQKKRRLYNRLFNTFYNVTNIIIRYHRTSWQSVVGVFANKSITVYYSFFIINFLFATL